MKDAKAYADEKGSALQSEVERVEAGYKEADTALQNQVNDVKQQAALNDRVNQVQNTQIAQLQSKDNAHDNAIADLEKTKADVTYVDEVKAEVEAGYKAADAQTLADAKGYADEKAAEVTEAYQAADEAIKTDVKANADAIEGLGGRVDKHDEAISGLNQRLGKMNGKVNKATLFKYIAIFSRLSAPAVCPSKVVNFLSFAHLLLPSMMMAICEGNISFFSSSIYTP